MHQNTNGHLQAFIGACKKHILQTQAKHGASPARPEKEPGEKLTVETVLPLIIENPMLVATPHRRIAEAILHAGTEPIPQELHYFYEHPERMFAYKPFERIYGIHDVLHELVLFFVAAAHGLESSRTLLWLISEPGHSKTEWLSIIKRLLEHHSVPVLKGCPNNDLALWALPTDKKLDFKERFGVSFSNYEMPGDICASCKQRLIEEYAYDYLRFPVQLKPFNERFGGIGIYTSDPKDISQDSVEEFTGSIEIGESELNPRAIEPGAFQIAQHGMLILEEGFRREPEMMHPLISASQSGHAQGPGRTGRVSTNVLVIITSNEEVYEEFRRDPTNSLYASRGIVFRFRRNLILQEEIKIFHKMLGRSNLSQDTLHLPPASMDLLGRVFVASALTGIEDANLHHLNNVIDLYNGADPETLDMTKPAWKVRTTQHRKKDGYKASLSIREMKGIVDMLLAQLEVEERHRTGQRQDSFHLCLPPFRVYEQLLKYLAELDRVDASLVSALQKFATFVFTEKTIPGLKEQFTLPSDLKAECERVFTAIKNGEFKTEIQQLNQVEDAQYSAFLENLERYDDDPDLARFIRKQALERISVNETATAQRHGEKEWCPICIHDVLEGLRAYARRS